MSQIQSLSAELRKIQSENIELYAKLADLRKEKSKLQQPREEKDSNNDFKSQIEAIMEEQKKERAKKASTQKQLQSIINDLKKIQSEIDEHYYIIQNNLIPIISAEEEMTNQFYQEVIEKCKKKPNSSNHDINTIENLLAQLSKKSKEYFESLDEIEKYTMLIAINENPIPQSSKISNTIQNCYLNIPGFNEVRNRRKVLFQIDNL